MKLNKHNLPILPVLPKKPRGYSTRLPFNFQGNQALSFLAIQSYQSELRTKGYVERHSRKQRALEGLPRTEDGEPQQGQSLDLW